MRRGGTASASMERKLVFDVVSGMACRIRSRTVISANEVETKMGSRAIAR
jgi:hypothetical protein